MLGLDDEFASCWPGAAGKRGGSAFEFGVFAPVSPRSERRDSYTHNLTTDEDHKALGLGVNGFKRWQYFRQHFSGRWGDEGQSPVSPRSQESLLKALSALDFPVSAKPSLFLTDDGFFELAWRDERGRSVQVEFGSSQFEIFVERAGIEETHPNRSLAEVIAKLGAA